MNSQFEICDPRESDDVVHSDPPVRDLDTVNAVMHRLSLVLGLAVIGALGAYGVCRTFTPLFAATASVMIDPREPKRMAVSTDPTSTIPPSEETVRKNEIAMIRSRKLAEVVIADLHLDREAEFDPTRRPPSAFQDMVERMRLRLIRLIGWPAAENSTSKRESGRSQQHILDEAVDLFLNRLGTTSTDASRVIEIRFLSESPERAARIANAIADQYMRQRVEQDFKEARAATQALQKEIEELNVKVRDSERAVEQMRREQGILPNADLKVLSEQISELDKELIAASAQRAAAEARVADLEVARAIGRVDTIAAVLGSPLIQRLQEQSAQLSAKLSELATIYGDSHPKIMEAQAELKDYRSKIEAEITKAAARYHSELTIAQQREKALRSMIDRATAKAAAATASEVNIRVYERDVEANRALMGQLVARLNDTEAQINRKGPEAQVISRATVPRSPSFPPKLAIVAIAFLFCGTSGTILAVFLERRDESIRSTTQLRHMTRARFLGAVPVLRRSRRPERLPPARVLAEKTSLFVENLRGVWFQIDHTFKQQAKTLLITSSVPNEGKSSIAASLARLLALGGRKIVIVDADLRHPVVHRVLGVRPSPGLTELISGEKALGEVLQPDNSSGAFVIAAGAPSPSPAEALQSPMLARILRGLATEFDAVIIDSPPVLAVHDAGILAQHVDMTVMVVRWGATRATTFITALQRLRDIDVAVGGVILSMVDPKRYEIYGYPDRDIFSRNLRKYYSR